MHVTPKQKKMEKRVMEKWIQCITFFTLHHTLNFVQLLLPPIIHSVSKQAFHYEQNSNLFFWGSRCPPPPWALISYSWFLTDCCSTFNNSWNAKVRNKSELFFTSVISMTHKATRINQFPTLYSFFLLGNTDGALVVLGFSFWSLLIFFLFITYFIVYMFYCYFLLLFIVFILCLFFLFNTWFLYNYCL